MVRVLAVSDEVVDALVCGLAEQLRPELIVGAGDLPFDYLESLATRTNAPCVFVPGNHDRDLTGYRRTGGGWTRAGLPVTDPGPRGAINADGRAVTVAGLRIAGLGGSIRYNDGPNQYRESTQRARARSLRVGLAVKDLRSRASGLSVSGVDILLTHSPARGVGDGDDAPHYGFGCLSTLTRTLRPQALIHGHVHPHGQQPTTFAIPHSRLRSAESAQSTRNHDGTTSLSASGATVSINTVGYTMMELVPGGNTITIERRRHGA